jgi:hypothetical protein
MLGGAADVRDVANPTVELPAALAEGGAFLLALNPRLSDWLPVVRHLLAGAQARSVADPRGGPLLLAFDVAGPPRSNQSAGGLRGELVVAERDREVRSARHDASLVFRESSRLSEGRPFEMRWIGHLLVDTPGEYRLELYTDGGAELLLHGRPVIQGRPAPEPRSLRTDLHLDSGAHPIEVHYTYTRGPGILELRWRPPGGERSLIPPTALRPN